MSEENVELTLRLMDAWNRRDVEAMSELWDPEGVFFPAFEMLEGRTYRGAAEVRQYFEDLAEFSDESRADYSEVHEVGDRVLILARVWFRFKNGVELDQEAAYAVRWRNGKCIEGHAWIGHTAHAEALEAAGVSE
jgi:ketosteroid isomerase-like protein